MSMSSLGLNSREVSGLIRLLNTLPSLPPDVVDVPLKLQVVLQSIVSNRLDPTYSARSFIHLVHR